MKDFSACNIALYNVRNVFMVPSHILLLFHIPEDSNKLLNMRNSENISHN